MPRSANILLLVLALLPACTGRVPAPIPEAGEGVPIEVARLWDVRGGAGIAAASPTWFQRRMALALRREGFAPKLLGHDDAPSGQGLCVTGRLEQLPSTLGYDGPPGEVAFRVEVRRDGEVILARSYLNRVWLGWPQMSEYGTAESALRQAADQALTDFARDAKRAASAPPPGAP